MSTICSIWCAHHEPLPALRSPSVAAVTSLRRARPVPRWVRHTLLTHFIISAFAFIIRLTAVICISLRFENNTRLSSYMNLKRSFLWLQPLQNSASPPIGQQSQSSTGESSDGLTQRAGPFPYHQIYPQFMHRLVSGLLQCRGKL